MRWLQLFVLLLAFDLLAVAAPVGAAEDGVDHVELIEGQLAPGAERIYDLKFGEGVLRKGWLFGLVGQVHAGTAGLELIDPAGQLAAQWRWEPTTQPRWDGLALPSDGDYRLRVTSVGSEALRYMFYYDQSCFCVGKKMPIEGGVVIFNGTAPTGSVVEAWLGMDSSAEISVQLAYRTAPAGRWPADYQILDLTPADDVQDDGRFRQEALSFTVPSSDPYYLVVQSRKGTGAISFLAQEGVARPAGPPTWLLILTGVALAISLGALGLALRAWVRVRRAGGTVTR